MNNENQEKTENSLGGGFALAIELYNYCALHNKLNCFYAIAKTIGNDFAKDKEMNEILENIVKIIEKELIETKEN